MFSSIYDKIVSILELIVIGAGTAALLAITAGW
jgi:hypothetical protein